MAPNGSRRFPVIVYLYVAALAASATLVGIVLAGSPLRQPGEPSWPALPFFGALLVAAEYLFVKFRYRGEINALNPVEAVLAPMLFAFPAHAAMPTLAIAYAIGDALRRNPPVKAAFNISQWNLAYGAGAAILWRFAGGGGFSPRLGAAVLVSLFAVGVVNQVAFSLVMAFAHRQRLRSVLAAFAPVMIPGWLVGWAVNSLMGVLFVAAYAAHPATVVLFPVPLVLLHLAYRGYAGARSDRVRLTGLHRAARVLAEPLDPHAAVEPFLREVAASFEARAAALVLPSRGGGRVIHRLVVEPGGTYATLAETPDTLSLEATLLSLPGPVRVRANGGDGIGRMLEAAGWRDCLAAPLLDGRVAGSLAVFDQTGLEGFEEGELAVLEAVAREVAATLSKGALLERIVEERRKLSEIVTTTNDGIFSLGSDGTVLSWNPAMERITGLRAADVIDQPEALAPLDVQTLAGFPVRLDRWAAGEALAPEIRLSDAHGRLHHISCSYSEAREDAGRGRTLVVVARDVTETEEMEDLRQRYGRLAESEALQRSIVERLQEAVMPARPAIPGVDLGVAYLASDPSVPTGGDLYDWQVLPEGELHVAVVDVLGHGVEATKDALSVVHALRTLALQRCPLERMIARADALLGAHHPELVATVMIVRYDPAAHRVRIAAGGHPPAVLVSAERGVRQLPAPGGAIGWPGAGSVAVAEVDLEPGDGVVLYTDGLVEARRDILEGTEALMRAAHELREAPADDLAAGLVRRALAEGDRRDDSLALVLRRAPVLRETWRIPPDRGHAHEVRRALMRWLADHHVGPEYVTDVAVMASELLTNAVVAARSAVQMRVRLDPAGMIEIEVEDDGPGRPDIEHLGGDAPPADADVGRGLYIVRSLSDRFDALSTFEGTVVRAVKELRPRARAGAGTRGNGKGSRAPSR